MVIDIESGNAGSVDISTAPGAAVDAVRVSADGSRVFAVVTADGGSALAVIDTKRRALVHTIPLIESVADIAVHPGGHLVYASGWDAQLGGVIVVIDAVGARVVDTVEVSGLPTQLVVSGQVLYCIDRDDVVVMSTATNRLIDCIDMGRSCPASPSAATEGNYSSPLRRRDQRAACRSGSRVGRRASGHAPAELRFDATCCRCNPARPKWSDW